MTLSKDDLRKIYKEKRKVLFEAGEISKISEIICGKIKEEDFFKFSKNVLIFYPKGSELNPLGLMKFFGSGDKNFYLPRCEGDKILACPYREGDELLLNKFKIYEPVSSPADYSVLDIVITPALACDKGFFRLGYGGGYYDRLFSDKNLKAKKVVIIPESFIEKKLPVNEYDKRCDVIVSEKGVYYRA